MGSMERVWHDSDREYVEMALISCGDLGLIAGWEHDGPSGGYKVALHGTQDGWVLRNPDMAFSFVAATGSAMTSGKVAGERRHDAQREAGGVEDMGLIYGFPVTYDRVGRRWAIAVHPGTRLVVSYDDVCSLAGLMHALDRDATRRSFTE